MADQQTLKYGWAPGYGGEPVYSIRPNGDANPGFLASEVLSKKSGRYVIYDISDAYWRVCADNETKIGGYVDQDLTCSSTNGGTKLAIAQNVDQFCTEMPYAVAGAVGTLTAAVLKTIIGKLIDIYVIGGIQYADNAALQTILRVVDGSVERNTLIVTVLNAKIDQVA